LYRGDYLRQALDRRPTAFFGAAAVVGHDDSIDTVLASRRGVLAEFDTFQDQLHRCRFLQTIDESPIHCWRVQADARNIDAFEHRLSPQRSRRAVVTRVAGPSIELAESFLRFGVAACWQVDRKGQDRATRSFSAFDHFLRHIPLAAGVKLIPDRTAK